MRSAIIPKILQFLYTWIDLSIHTFVSYVGRGPIRSIILATRLIMLLETVPPHVPSFSIPSDSLSDDDTDTFLTAIFSFLSKGKGSASGGDEMASDSFSFEPKSN